MKYLKRLKVVFERSEYKNPIKGQVRAPEQLCELFKDLKDEAKETLLGVYLNHNLELNVYELLTIGSESETLVMPDEIFRSAILTNSKYFILIHNHPSGKAAPSPSDLEVIHVLRQQSKIMRRQFLDFIIVSDEKYWSMFEEIEGGDYTLGAVLL